MVTVSGAVSMTATADLDVVGDSHVTTPTLLQHVTAVAGQDPALIGALGYGDEVYTTRLVGDIN